MQQFADRAKTGSFFQVKAAKELEENSNKIDSLLNWVASLEQKGELPEYRPHSVSAGTGTQAGKSTGDVPDGHAVGADSAAESLDEQYERLKVSTDTSSQPKPSALYLITCRIPVPSSLKGCSRFIA